MTKQELKQYLPLKRELAKLDGELENLEAEALDMPAIAGKVIGSMPDFPYLKRHITVQIADPAEAERVSRQRRQKEQRREEVARQIGEIESFIAGIGDIADREIFTLLFLEGKTQQEAADIVGYSQGRISQKIRLFLKD